MAPRRISPQLLWRYLRIFMRQRFSLAEDQASEEATIEDISKGVVFKGTNLWILIFAIMVASVGLNVNSTAVIIGAMLISPLMGPIMGVGLGVGINDFELIVKSLKNLAIAVAISILTSAIYFWMSPLSDARSELLARTQPTIWDVLIALFGGLAGIVAGSRKEKSNAIPGVAIATALMPPLCTAGYGLGTGQWNYFFGAFYLFFINSVFISFSTYLIVRLLRFPPKQFLDQIRERRVKRYIAIFVFLTIIPSIYTAYQVVQQSFFERSAQIFVDKEFVFDNCSVIERSFHYGGKAGHRIEVMLYGAHQDEEKIADLEQKMPNYGLKNVTLVVRQGFGANGSELASLTTNVRSGIIEELYQRNEEQLRNKDSQIELLEDEILALRAREMPVVDLAREVRVINPNVSMLTVAPSFLAYPGDSIRLDTVYLAYAQFRRRPAKTETTQLEEWLKARIRQPEVMLVSKW